MHLLLFALATSASAQQIWKKSALLADMFPASARVAPVSLTLDDTAAAAFTAALGYAPPRRQYTLYRASTADQTDGYVLFDDQIGQHEPITFAVQLDPAGTVLRQEVVVYREKYGAEVRHARFRNQFVGLDASAPVVAGRDIRIVSGATYSSKSMAVGVKRALWLAAQLIGADQAVARAPE